MRLITIPMSHYCEKARWGLERAGLAYREDAHLQVFHYRAARRYNPTGMVPVLVTGEEVICDSTAILQYIDRRLPEADRLYPAQYRSEVESLEEQFDEQLGVETRRWVYFHWQQLPTREVLSTAGQGAPAWERRLAPLLMPLLLKFLEKRLAINPANIKSGARIIQSSFDQVAARLSDGRAYLCGHRFTAADLAFASMAAPVLLPPEYGIRLPSLDQAPASARAQIRQFRAHPAGAYALRLFRNVRRQNPALAPHLGLP